MSDKEVKKKKISISLTSVYISCLDQLVEAGVFVRRDEAIKASLRILFRQFEMPPFAFKKPQES